MTHTIVLPVPSTVRSQFVVLAPDHVPADLRLALRRWASRVRGPRSALDAVRDSHLSIALLDSTALGDTEALLRAGNPPHLVHRVRADPHLLVSCDGSPAQPTAPALTSFGIANVLALEAGGLMFDPLTAEISDPDRELAEAEVELTGPPVLSLKSWVRFWAHDSRVRTYGMTRFGLPDLSTSDVPTELAEDWTFVLAATGSVLITSVWETWSANPRSTFLEVHNPLMLCDHHVHTEAFAIDLLTNLTARIAPPRSAFGSTSTPVTPATTRRSSCAARTDSRARTSSGSDRQPASCSRASAASVPSIRSRYGRTLDRDRAGVGGVELCSGRAPARP